MQFLTADNYSMKYRLIQKETLQRAATSNKKKWKGAKGTDDVCDDDDDTALSFNYYHAKLCPSSSNTQK